MRSMSKTCEDIISVLSVCVCVLDEKDEMGAVFIIERRTNYDELLPMSSFDYTSMNLPHMHSEMLSFSCLPADFDQRASKRAAQRVERTVRLA